MLDAFVRLTLIDGNGIPKESLTCFPNESNGGGVNRGMLVFRTGTTFSTVLDSLEPGAFIVIELLHYKKGTAVKFGVRLSLKCWSFIDIQSSLSSKSNTLDLVLLQKPVKLKSVKMEIKRFPSSSAFLLVVGSRARISSERERCAQCEL